MKWNYKQSPGVTTCTSDTPCGPGQWEHLVENGKPDVDCGKHKQGSPLDLKAEDTSYKAMDNITIVDSKTCNSALFEMNEHTTQVGASGTCPDLFKVVKDGKDYPFYQFHFHSPSEHLIDGERYPLEMHYVHQAKSGEIIVLAIMVGVKEDYKSEFATFIEKVHSLIPKGGEANGDNDHQIVKEWKGFSPYNTFMESSMKKGFKHYIGSTTTPPCNVDTLWILMEEPLYISKETLKNYRAMINDNANNQLAKFGSILGNSSLKPTFAQKAGDLKDWDYELECNFRPPQDLAGRPIYTTKQVEMVTPKEEKKGFNWAPIGILVGVALLGSLGFVGYKKYKSSASARENLQEDGYSPFIGSGL